MEQEVFVKAYEKVRPIVLKAFRQYLFSFGIKLTWSKRR